MTLSDDNCIPGDEITVTAKADPGYRLKTILVNGQAISGNSFVAEEGVDYVVSAEFEFYRGVKAHGTCGNNIVWYLYDNNELSIQGTGEMDGNPWTEYDDSIESVVIGQGVTTIDDNAFRNCSNLKTLTLPDSIAEIGHYTLSGCNVDSLYYNGDVKGWLSVYFRSNFLSPVKELYINDDLISDLHIPDGISKIPDYAFEGYSALQSVHFSAEVNYIGDYAFDCTSNLKYVEFTGNAPHTFARPFGNTDSTLVYYHQGTTGWTSPKWNGYYASCLEIDNYNTLDENNCNAQGISFTLNPTAKTATVGDGSSAINNSGYYGAQMGAVVIPDTVIKDGVSYQVIGIGKNAFYRNNHVTSVTIGANVSSVIPSAFAGCTSLKEITVDNGNQYFCSSEGVLYDIGKLYLYIYPAQKTEESFTVPDTVKTIGQYAFYGNRCRLYCGREKCYIYLCRSIFQSVQPL